MGFSERDKLIALAIVHIFETSKPFGDYSAVAVLDDGAGISYGINQFTHRSGSLAAVIDRFNAINVRLGRQVMLDGYTKLLADRSPASIRKFSGDVRLKNGLKVAAARSEMQRAQREIAFEKYLKPAIDACEGSDFTLPMSLAVIFDSINHGSFERIRDRVVINPPGNGSMKPEEFEKLWIMTYVKKRDAWLESIPRLAVTDYRTDFFLAQIARGNWNLDLPMSVHGFRLTDSILDSLQEETFADLTDSEIEENISVLSDGGDTPVPAPIAVTANEPADRKTETAMANPDQAQPPQQIAENITNVQTGENTVPANFVPEDKSADAPPPTGFIGKLKAQGAALLATIGGAAGLKEWFGIQLSGETVDLLKILLPTVLGLGFIGFLVWFVAEKIVGFKTLKLQSEINTDPNKHNLKINPQ